MRGIVPSFSDLGHIRRVRRGAVFVAAAAGPEPGWGMSAMHLKYYDKDNDEE